MTVAQSFAADTWWILVAALVVAFVCNPRSAVALLAVWLVCLAALYWRAA